MKKSGRKLRVDGFKEVTLDADDIRLMQKFSPDLASFGYEVGDSMEARFRADVYEAAQTAQAAEEREREKAKKAQADAKRRAAAIKPIKKRTDAELRKLVDKIRDHFPSLSGDDLAAHISAAETQIIDVDKHVRGNARSLAIQLHWDLLFRLLAAREERVKLERRIEALEQGGRNLADAYCGPHIVGKQYTRGDVVQMRGSAWLAMLDTETVPGTEGNHWKLFVKAGRDAQRGRKADEDE